MSPSNITNKLWNYCNVLRDDGMSYGDYVEAAPAHPWARGIRTSMSSTAHTYLLFLKMADERTQAPYHRPSIVPQQYSWSLALTPALSLRERGNTCGGDDLFDQSCGARGPALARRPGSGRVPRAFGGSIAARA